MVDVEIDGGGLLSGVGGLNGDGIVADPVKHGGKGELAGGNQLGGIQVLVVGKHADGGLVQRRAADLHLVVHLALDAAVPAFADVGVQLQQDVLGFAVQGHDQGVFPVILGLALDHDVVVADGLNGGVVGDQAVLGADEVGIVFPVDGHGAAALDLELNLVFGAAVDLHEGDVGGDQGNGGQGHVHVEMDDVHQPHFSAGGPLIGRHGDVEHGVRQVRHVLIPLIIGNFKGGVAPDGHPGHVKLFDVDFRPLFGRDADDVGGQVVIDGRGNDDVVLQAGAFRRGKGRQVQEKAPGQHPTRQEQHQNKRADELSHSGLPLGAEGAAGRIVPVDGMDVAAVRQYALDVRLVAVIVVVVDGVDLGGGDARPVLSGIRRSFLRVGDDIAAAGGVLASAARPVGQPGIGMGFRFAQAALLLIAAKPALPERLHLLGQCIAAVRSLIDVAVFVDVEINFFLAAGAHLLLPVLLIRAFFFSQRSAALKAAGQGGAVPGAAAGTLHVREFLLSSDRG